ncbi:hypothetical protein KQI65_02390 [bacterium]|nr:hypothetical protein [bacterium]
MQFLHIFSVLLLLVAFAGCEQTLDINEIQEEEKLVVCGGVFVTPDSLFTNFWFQRTGSLGKAYRGEDMIVSNVDLTLQSGGQDIPLPQNKGWYYGETMDRELMSARRHAATGGATDFTLSFFWKEHRIPVELHAPELPVSLPAVNITEAMQDGTPSYEIAYAYPDFRDYSEVVIYFDIFIDSTKQWQDYVRARVNNWLNWPFTVVNGMRLYTLRDWRPVNTIARFRYRIQISDAVQTEARRAMHLQAQHYTDDELHPVFRPTGSNPDFNVYGDGTGFVWYERLGPWIEIP